MADIDYYQKYLKYKTKYLDLKSEIQGGAKEKQSAEEIALMKKFEKQLAAAKNLYSAGYSSFAGSIKGALGPCAANEEELERFHDTLISKTNAKAALKKYEDAGGNSEGTFRLLRNSGIDQYTKGGYCKMTNKVVGAVKAYGEAHRIARG